jgi:NlpC/P60 family putative phage cell wall peptidase
MRQQIIERALAWVGTPYHHQARVKGVGVDCAHFVAGVALECDLIPSDSILPLDYSPEWNLHNKQEMLVDYLIEFGCTETFDAKPGDILCFHIGHAIGHLGILLPGQRYVHAQNMVRPSQVTINSLSGKWLKRCTRTFSFPGVKPK